jgi:hypothetical protein
MRSIEGREFSIDATKSLGKRTVCGAGAWTRRLERIMGLLLEQISNRASPEEIPGAPFTIGHLEPASVDFRRTPDRGISACGRGRFMTHSQ